MLQDEKVKLTELNTLNNKIQEQLQSISERRRVGVKRLAELENHLCEILSAVEMGEAPFEGVQSKKQQIQKCREDLEDVEFAERGLKKRLLGVEQKIKDQNKRIAQLEASERFDTLAARAKKIQYAADFHPDIEQALYAAGTLADRQQEAEKLIRKLKALPKLVWGMEV